METAEVIARLERMLAVELDARARCENLKRMGDKVVDCEELDRHVAACNRNATALTVAITVMSDAVELDTVRGSAAESARTVKSAPTVKEMKSSYVSEDRTYDRTAWEKPSCPTIPATTQKRCSLGVAIAAGSAAIVDTARSHRCWRARFRSAPVGTC
jgi:hypothetical protein